MEYPVLSKIQKKRLKQIVLSSGFDFYSSTKLNSLLRTSKGCKEVFLKVVPFLENPVFSLGNDLCSLYIDDDSSVSYQVKKKVRGKNKSPLMVSFHLRINPDQLVKLKQLGGNKSEHIRKAIDQYLSGIENGKKEE